MPTTTSETCWCGGEVTLGATGDFGPVRHCADSVAHDPDATGHKAEIRKLYVAGPMTGFPECNYPAFDMAEEHLHRLGYDVVNPAHVSAGLARTHYVDHLREDLRAMLDCDGVATLPGWEFSTGARNEVNVAGLLRMPVRPLELWGPRG